MTEERISGCDSYRVCPRCGTIVYFMNRLQTEPNLLQRNIESDPKNQDPARFQPRTLTCKCGTVIPLC